MEKASEEPSIFILLVFNNSVMLVEWWRAFYTGFLLSSKAYVGVEGLRWCFGVDASKNDEGFRIKIHFLASSTNTKRCYKTNTYALIFALCFLVLHYLDLYWIKEWLCLVCLILNQRRRYCFHIWFDHRLKVFILLRCYTRSFSCS